MPTNLAIDDRLLEDAQKVGGQRTKRETVNEANQLAARVRDLAIDTLAAGHSLPPLTR